MSDFQYSEVSQDQSLYVGRGIYYFYKTTNVETVISLFVDDPAKPDLLTRTAKAENQFYYLSPVY